MRKSKVIVLSVISGLIVAIVAYFVIRCNFAYFYYDYDELIVKVEKVEIVDASNPAKPVVLYTIPDEEKEEFLNDLSKIKFTYNLQIQKHDMLNVAVKLNFYDGKTITFDNNTTYSKIKKYQGGACNYHQYCRLVSKYYDGEISLKAY